MQKSSVAATVGTASISEDTVTEYIEGFRSKNENCETDEGWASFLAKNGYTAESMRNYVLENVFIPHEVVRAKCAEMDITVSEDELSSAIAAEKEYYEQRYGADSWASVLASYGYDEESWRENEEARLLEQRCKDQVVGTIEPSQSQLQTYANENISTYNGKHSYYLSFDSLEEAQAVYDSFDSADHVSLEEFSAPGGAVNAGWSSVEADQKRVSADYITALNDLEAKQVSEPMEDGDAYVLIYCDKVFSAKGMTRVKLGKLPQGILAALTSDCEQLLEDEAYDSWLQEATSQMSVTINDMPDGLPYDVNVALDDE